MNKGDKIVCIRSRGYLLTEGATYMVEKYEPEEYYASARFTYPAYVYVIDDSGKAAVCHASRFRYEQTR